MIDDPTLPDDTAAMRSLLLLDADLRVLVNDRVFCQELPPNMQMDDAVSQNAVLVQDTTGAPGIQGYVRLREPYYNVFCLGETPELAKHIYLRVHQILKQARRQVLNECLIHSYDEVNPPRAQRDPATKWPYNLSVWKSLSSDQQAV